LGEDEIKNGILTLFIIQRNRDDNEKLGISKVSNIMYLKLAVNFGIELTGLRLYE